MRFVLAMVMFLAQVTGQPFWTPSPVPTVDGMSAAAIEHSEPFRVAELLKPDLDALNAANSEFAIAQMKHDAIVERIESHYTNNGLHDPQYPVGGYASAVYMCGYKFDSIEIRGSYLLITTHYGPPCGGTFTAN